MMGRDKTWLDHINSFWGDRVNLFMSRQKANYFRSRIISENEGRVVSWRLKRKIKDYCRANFGSASYWPWLALYSEVRGDFKEGWIPYDYYRFTLLPSMNPEKFMKFSEAKTIDYKLFNELVVPPVFFRSNGLYHDKDGLVQKKQEIQKQLYDLDDEIIIKPDGGRGGDQIIFEHSAELSLNALPADNDLLFQRVVRQHSELNRLYPHSINTFRVLTFMDGAGVVHIKFIIIRFGRGGSRVDNTSSGGGWVFVQRNGKVRPISYDGYGISLGTQHPDTGIEFAELELPFLPKIINLCKKTHRSFPYTRIIGWDVFINEKEEPKMIEWNANNPGFWEYEALFGPFFSEVVLG